MPLQPQVRAIIVSRGLPPKRKENKHISNKRKKTNHLTIPLLGHLHFGLWTMGWGNSYLIQIKMCCRVGNGFKKFLFWWFVCRSLIWIEGKILDITFCGTLLVSSSTCSLLFYIHYKMEKYPLFPPKLYKDIIN